MNSRKSIFLGMSILLVTLFCSSCEKVVDIKLDSSAVQIVIEGEVSTAKGPYAVTVSESKNVEENNSFTGRTDAIVVINDLTAGISERLSSTGFGKYITSFLVGKPGHTYQMIVTVDNKVYMSTVNMPVKEVKIEGLYVESSSFDSEDIFMVPVFTDPEGKGNYYRLRQWINNTLVKGSFVRSDEATDGRRYNAELYYSTDAKDGNPLIQNGDSLTVELQCIQKEVYDFYRTLNATIAQDVSTPSNPLTNISGGALGVFNACRSHKMSFIAKF